MARSLPNAADTRTSKSSNATALTNRPRSATSKKGKNKHTRKQIGSAKGIETMFRSAYRAQLDMLALAATKANIMISLNGFVASMLMVSGAFIYATEPLFLPPAIVFLITSVISIYFALWAASPASSPEYESIFSWLRRLLSGKANLQHLKNTVSPIDMSFEDRQSNILVFEDFARLSKDDYLERMEQLLTNHNQIYEKMSDQLYWFGLMADKKFKMLRMSYAVFRWGIILSVIALLTVKLYAYLFQTNTVTHAHASTTGISEFNQIYEPSGVQQLSDGRAVIIEDEHARALNIVDIQPDGRITNNAVLNKVLRRSFRRPLEDLEGVAVDSQGYAYAITSHSRIEKGRRRRNREQLIRFKIEDNRLVTNAVYTGLVELIEHKAVLRDALKTKGHRSLHINIEALSFDPYKKRLLIGFRDPKIHGKSLIVILENPAELFDRNEQPRLSDDIILLDLQDSGIRSLVYDPQLNGYLLTSELKGKKHTHSKIWYWSGVPGDDPRPIKAPGLKALKNVEGIAPITISGKRRLLVVSDDGDASKKSPAHYMLLEYNQLAAE